MFFLFLFKNVDCGYSLEPPRRGGSNKYPQSMFKNIAEAVLTSTHNLCFEQKYEKYQRFLFENFHFLEVKFSIYLDRRVFVMVSLFPDALRIKESKACFVSKLNSSVQCRYI